MLKCFFEVIFASCFYYCYGVIRPSVLGFWFRKGFKHVLGLKYKAKQQRLETVLLRNEIDNRKKKFRGRKVMTAGVHVTDLRQQTSVDHDPLISLWEKKKVTYKRQVKLKDKLRVQMKTRKCLYVQLMVYIKVYQERGNANVLYKSMETD